MGESPAFLVYQWQVPYVIDDRRFRATFVEATPVDEALATMLALDRGSMRGAA